MANKRIRSSVWKHFEKAGDDPEYAVCLVHARLQNKDKAIMSEH